MRRARRGRGRRTSWTRRGRGRNTRAGWRRGARGGSARRRWTPRRSGRAGRRWPREGRRRRRGGRGRSRQSRGRDARVRRRGRRARGRRHERARREAAGDDGAAARGGAREGRGGREDGGRGHVARRREGGFARVFGDGVRVASARGGRCGDGARVGSRVVAARRWRVLSGPRRRGRPFPRQWQHTVDRVPTRVALLNPQPPSRAPPSTFPRIVAMSAIGVARAAALGARRADASPPSPAGHRASTVASSESPRLRTSLTTPTSW